jgi:hypothetical protein
MENEIREASGQHLEAARKEQEQVKELLRRGSVRHYFLGPENVWSQEGFGTVVGGALTVFFGGVIFPQLIRYSNSGMPLDKLCWIMVALGIALCGKGVHGMIKESRRERKTVSDQVHDEILQHDLETLKETSKKLLKEHFPRLKEEEPVDAMEILLVKGPRDYVHNSNLPLAWKLGDDGILRYSNFSFMALYFGKENIYIYTSIFNMRNGTSKFQHIYECSYDKLRFAGFEDKTAETVNQQNKSVVQYLKMLVIDAGDGENDKLAMPVSDYGMIKKMGGIIDNTDAEAAVKRLSERITFFITQDRK